MRSRFATATLERPAGDTTKPPRNKHNNEMCLASLPSPPLTTTLTCHTDNHTHQLPAGVRRPQLRVVGLQAQEGLAGGGPLISQHNQQVAQLGIVQHGIQWQVPHRSLQGQRAGGRRQR